jgi:DNA invertase Pin-like site-specific DNA recombinase
MDKKEEIPNGSGVVEAPDAYSYVRFSTLAQELGGSLQRQVVACEAYCIENGLNLHAVSYRDLGVSAFKRKNIEKGALSAFISAVKSGIIKKGSYLIIEQFDRLSRADVDVALRLLLDLVHSGILVVTLSDKKVWDRPAIKDVGDLILAIVYMSRANNESAAKSLHLTYAWGQKKLKAGKPGEKIVTSECPLWLKPNESKTGFIVIEEKAESVRKVFAARLAGLGAGAITRKANTEGWPVPGKVPPKRRGDTEPRPITWWASNVTRMLTNRAVLGEYQPHINSTEDDSRIPAGDPVKGYYPAILDETVFLRVQAARNRQTERGSPFPGRRDASYKNWLQGILKCECGQSYVRKNKNSLAQPGYARYYCQGRNKGSTKCPGSSAQALESAVLTIVSTMAPQVFSMSARMETLRADAEMAEVECSVARQTKDRFEEAIATSTVPIPTLLPRLAAAHAALVVQEKKLAAVRAEIAEADGDSDSVFENILRAVKDLNSVEARAALREDLSRVLEKVIVHESAGYIEAYLRGGAAPVLHPLRVADVAVPGMTLTTLEGSINPDTGERTQR